MIDSILESIEKKLGILSDYEYFDPDLVMDINSAFLILNQLGVGPSKPFSITGREDKWSDFMSDEDKVELVKSYVYLRTRLLFDPPTSSALMEAINKQISEFEWRLNIQVDP